VTVVAIHQPNYVPWLGYFFKIANTEIFIFLNDAEFSKNSYINRNRIKTQRGAHWLTVPVNANSTSSINEVRIANMIWNKKHVKTLKSAYGKAPFFQTVFPWFEDLLTTAQFDFLSELNIHIIKKICNKMEFVPRFKISSDYNVKSKRDDRLIALVKEVGGTHYLSGYGGAKYQDPKKFEKNGIDIKYYNYQPPVYAQLWGAFTPNLSILDLLFNIGFESTSSLLKQ
jgi:hypothetical protein|tara:strand:+ start:1262 stop:1942 length:681 start_codon:yes stop_codon:yes gene_type:complete